MAAFARTVRPAARMIARNSTPYIAFRRGYADGDMSFTLAAANKVKH